MGGLWPHFVPPPLAPPCLLSQTVDLTNRALAALGGSLEAKGDLSMEPSQEEPKASVRRGVIVMLGLTASALLGLGSRLAATESLLWAPEAPEVEGRRLRANAASEEDPVWGCGLLGKIPGISESGASKDTQKFIDALKKSSSFNKVMFWNWNLAPEEPLTEDFIFMPEVWGSGVVNEEWVRQADTTNFLDSHGKQSPATMANLMMGMNEPDIQGSCMGNMFGRCVKPCDDAAVHGNDCPKAELDVNLPPASANSRGMCNCWESAYATGVGFWPVGGCSALQPLPELWEQEPGCINTVMTNWKKTAAIAVNKGYKYLSTPLLAVYVSYAEKFIEYACDCHNGVCGCTDASCGCPVYVGLHFYAFDCRPVSTSAYYNFQARVQDIAQLMEKYPFIKGAIVNEVGMLNCAGPTEDDPICVPDSGQFPAKDDPHFSCPQNEELPNGLASFVTRILEIALSVKTSDGRPVVKSFAWFNQDREGGTYNLRLFDDDGKVNEAGEAYMKVCKKWKQLAA
ncbi:hypothetical protein AK812_SmicGene15467 [Symbiodinium microadriaticum]|uniref:Asl1-like glycosyl hydrolase catalytic domain-containing protein n=1 Tax=Symbiodinium microadriaticum TaxID=2951 RepID=A0A1Q9E2W5_SYMMI|nr:hypothetical protein AK812_SmicGene15467 [Symbiodinium microadriaticum]CAE7677684.1 unnamed protein product [Symbiodinium sp. KB8]CAE7833075.1 unnamed protein product [Symbiodinium microadriaticum]